jgi:aryl-alcohol dehydrogenase-like predicted oxidoreductase
LTGALDKQSISGEGDWRSVFPRFSDENFDTNIHVVNQLKALAETKGCTAAQLAIAWVLRQGPDIIPIPGTKRIKYLEENVGAIDVQLTDAEEAEIRRIVAGIAGERLPEWVSYQCFVDTVEPQ